MKKLNQFFINKRQTEKAEHAARHEVMIKVITRFNILKMKQKISYSAFMNNITIKELWLQKILETLNILKETK